MSDDLLGRVADKDIGAVLRVMDLHLEALRESVEDLKRKVEGVLRMLRKANTKEKADGCTRKLSD